MFNFKRSRVQLFLFSILVAVSLSSCFSEKKITYFQKDATHSDTVSVSQPFIPKIQSGDILSVYVNSLSPEASTYFNPYNGGAVGNATVTGGGGASSVSAPAGYLVDPEGKIDLPLIGSLKVGGLTTQQAKDSVKNAVSVYLKDPTVIVRIVNYKISLLGEVRSPGVYTIPNERITLPEAITLAGDLTAYAKLTDIQIIREINGKKVFASVDFTSRNIFDSPYYYLRGNDIVYVKATKNKLTETDVIFRVVPFLLGLITFAIGLLSRFL